MTKRLRGWRDRLRKTMVWALEGSCDRIHVVEKDQPHMVCQIGLPRGTDIYPLLPQIKR